MSRGSSEQCNIDFDEDNDTHQLPASVETLNSQSIHTPASFKQGSTAIINLKSSSKFGPKKSQTQSRDTNTFDSTTGATSRSSYLKPDQGTGKLSKFAIPTVPTTPKKMLLTPLVPTCNGDSATLIQIVNSQEIPEVNAFSASGIKIENEYLSLAMPAMTSGVSCEKSPQSSPIDVIINLQNRKSPGQSIPSREQQEQPGTNIVLDTNIDFEEILKNQPDFNRYYEEKMARIKQKASSTERRTALHAALGMTYAARVSRSDLRSFEKF